MCCLAVAGCAVETDGDRYAADGGDSDAGYGSVSVSEQALTAACTGAGLQANSPWPMRSICPLHLSQSPYIAAQNATLAWPAKNLGGDIRTSAAIAADGTIYVANNNLLLPKFYALNANGTEKWSFSLLTGGFESSPAIGTDGTIYVGNNLGQLLAINPANGNTKWTYTGILKIAGSPVIGPDGTIYIGSQGLLFTALNPNGSTKWTQLKGAVRSSAALAADGTLYFGGDDLMLHAHNSSNGAQKWQTSLSGFVSSSPTIGSDGTVYVGSENGRLYAVNPSNGAIKWSYPASNVAALGSIKSSPVIATNGTIYFGSDDKKVYAITPGASSATLKWAHATTAAVVSTPAIGNDGVVYVGSTDKKLYALRATDGSELFTVTTGGAIYTSPAISANGTVIFGSDDNKLYAVGPGPAQCTPTASNDVTCNGVDDDCDGVKDENYAPAATSCGVGACARTGATSCVNGAVVNSCNAGSPLASSDTSCDGIDDDCDGTKDENYAPSATSCGVGVCSSTGATSCVNGTVLDSCVAGTPAASDSDCNNLDDNCNGLVDDGYVGTTTFCGNGICFRAGTTTCTAGVLGDSCTPGQPNPIGEYCDGGDNDCDSIIDEGYVSTPTTCGVGACAATGATSCTGGVELDSCTAGAPAVSDSTCDGVDDDCDGSIDEDFASSSTSCGSGICATGGALSCNAGSVQDSCTVTCEGACGDSSDDDDDGATDCADSDCAADPTCTASPASSIGQPCVTGADCGEGEICDASSFPGGYCYKPCDNTQPAGSECPSGTVCWLGSSCVLPCNAGGTCDNPSFVCDGLQGIGLPPDPFCRPTCSVSCATGLTCDPVTNTCF